MSAFNTASLNAGLPSGSSSNASTDELGSHFKAAALSIATLYKSALANSSTSHAAGYRACLIDLQTFMHAGVSLQGQSQGLGLGLSTTGHGLNPDGLTIERVMDWVEARLEALKDEDDSEDDAGEKDPRRGASSSQPRRRDPPPSSSSSTTAHRQPQPLASSSSHPPSRRSLPTTDTTKRSTPTPRRSPDRTDHSRARTNATNNSNISSAHHSSSRHSSPGSRSPRSLSPTLPTTHQPSKRKDRFSSSAASTAASLAIPSGVGLGLGFGSNVLQNLHHYPFEFAVPGHPLPTLSNTHTHTHTQGLGLIFDHLDPASQAASAAPPPVTMINPADCERERGDRDTSIPPATATGAKRRHASIVSAESTTTPTRTAHGHGHGQTPGSGSRRRPRGGGRPSNNAGSDAAMAYEPMDVEGERARKIPRR